MYTRQNGVPLILYTKQKTYWNLPFLYTYVLIIQSSFVFFPKHLYLSLVIFRKVFVPLSLERSMPLWYAIVRFLGEQEIVADFFFRHRETPVLLWLLIGYGLSARIWKVAATTSCLRDCGSSVLFYNKRYGTSWYY